MGRRHDCKSDMAHRVKEAASGVGIANLAPHDLRRTCARLCHASGGELEQIQFLFGTFFRSDHGTLSRLKAEDSISRKRSHRYRAKCIERRSVGEELPTIRSERQTNYPRSAFRLHKCATIS